jgi:hypothetical protein
MIVEKSTFIASQFSNAVSINSTSADVRLSGDFLDHWSGWKAVNGGKWRLGVAPTAARTRYALEGTLDSYVEMYTADNSGFGLPAANHVRSGISYGGGAVTGSCAVPTAGSVALGVPVDATTGTAILTQANVQSALTAQGLTSARAGNLDNLDATVSSRLAPSGTLATVTTLTNAPTSVTPAQIRIEMDANSTKLANLNATVSSRLAAADYNAPTSAPTAASVASAVWSAATKEITGGTVTTLTNAPSVPTPSQIASQVRSELSVELARVDAAITTRATPANIPAADITAIKAKTDAINVDRINNTATLSQVGNLLAQANS